MTVSVIIPSYNKEAFIEKTIRSVLDQTHSSVEIIVVDDGSTDDSWSIIRSFGDKIKAIRQENQGACHARNRGTSRASGEALMFLDADDLIAPNTISALVQVLEEEGECIAACPWNFLVWDGEKWISEDAGNPDTPPNEDYILGWLTDWFVPPCGLLWHRAAYEKTGGWNDDLTANQDGDLVLRALLEGIDVVQTQNGQAYWRNYDDTEYTSKSRNDSKEDLLSRARVMETVAARLKEQGRLVPYAKAIAQNLHQYAKRGYNEGVDGDRLEEIVSESRDLAGTDAITGTRLHCLATRMLGLRRKEKLASMLAQFGIGSRIRRKNSNNSRGPLRLSSFFCR